MEWIPASRGREGRGIAGVHHLGLCHHVRPDLNSQRTVQGPADSETDASRSVANFFRCARWDDQILMFHQRKWKPIARARVHDEETIRVTEALHVAVHHPSCEVIGLSALVANSHRLHHQAQELRYHQSGCPQCESEDVLVLPQNMIGREPFDVAGVVEVARRCHGP